MCVAVRSVMSGFETREGRFLSRHLPYGHGHVIVDTFGFGNQGGSSSVSAFAIGMRERGGGDTAISGMHLGASAL